MRSVFHKTFNKKFKKLPDKVQMAFHARLAIFENNPFHPLLENHDVSRAFPGCRSINVTGDFRAIFYERRGLAVFINIGTHSELYG